MIIKCKRLHLEQRCFQRGYLFSDAEGCVVSSDGEDIVVDTDHPSYPKTQNPGPPTGPEEVHVSYEPATDGPGTELKRLLKKIGITATPNCSCNARALAMDENEKRIPGWCQKNIDQIVGWLREEASKRGLPFIDAAGRAIVRMAIKSHEKKKKLKAGKPRQ